MPSRWALAAALALALPAAPAGAYVRYHNKQTGREIYWQEGCVAVTVYLNGYVGMTANEVAKATAAAAHTWSSSRVSCAGADGGATHPYLEIVPSMSQGGPTPHVGDDQRNSVIIQVDHWDNSAQAYALTTITSRGDGHIVDADIEVNAFDPPFDSVWGNIDDIGSVNQSKQAINDLQNTLTHEFGHFIGLDHSCYNPFGDAEQMIDVDNNPVPVCDDTAPPEVQATVMWAYENPFEVNKRMLTSDEVRADCDIYAADLAPRTCVLDFPADGCGCSAGRGGGRPGAPAAAGLLLAIALLRARRAGRARRARRGSSSAARRPRARPTGSPAPKR